MSRFTFMLVIVMLTHVPALVTAEDSSKDQSQIAVRLSFSVDEYDPSTPSAETMKLTVRNDSNESVEVPVGYDAQKVVISGKDLMLYKIRKIGAPKDEVKTAPLDPGREQTVVEIPLDALFQTAEKADRLWAWTWPRRPKPPPSPIHNWRKPGFVEQAQFSAQVIVGGEVLKSNTATLKVKPSMQ